MPTDFESGLAFGACLDYCIFHKAASLHDLEERVWPQLHFRFDVPLEVFRTAASEAIQESQKEYLACDDEGYAFVLKGARSRYI